MKDRFSQQANIYAKFRPEYPSVLYDFILKNTENRSIAWDCATGNGQAAKVSAQYFEKVYATDISQKQIDNATKADNIEYSISSAEKTPFEDNTFDLITVAQAAHWFDFDTFYDEVKRVAKPNATLAVWGYGTISVDDENVDNLLQNFYWNVIGKYWDAERKHIDNHYETLPFPFENVENQKFSMVFNWHRYELEGYLNTWSSVQNFINSIENSDKIGKGYNPIPNLMLDISAYWHEYNRITVLFPIFLKLSKIKP